MFIGDCAYPRGENFQTPIKGHFLEMMDVLFNYRLSRARRSVENAFGILQMRFEILHSGMAGSLPLVKAVILACMALHNLHLLREDSIPPNRRQYRPPGYADYIDEEGRYVYGRWSQENPQEEKRIAWELVTACAMRSTEKEDMDGIDVKEKLMSYFIDNPLPWQWKALKIIK